MDEVIDVTQLAGRFKNRKELQQYSEMLFVSFKQAVEKLQKLEAENKHLKELLARSVPQLELSQENNVVKLVVPDEQAIAEIQLKKLAQTAKDRELTLDETKRYDLLTKNLYLSKSKSPKTIDAKTKAIEQIEDAELVKIAKTDE